MLFAFADLSLVFQLTFSMVIQEVMTSIDKWWEADWPQKRALQIASALAMCWQNIIIPAISDWLWSRSSQFKTRKKGYIYIYEYCVSDVFWYLILYRFVHKPGTMTKATKSRRSPHHCLTVACCGHLFQHHLVAGFREGCGNRLFKPMCERDLDKTLLWGS